jgi:predicted MPP superfamily phosphohydrolase
MSSSPATLLAWAVVSTSILGLGHYYLWRRLVRDVVLPRPWHGLTTAVVVLLLVSQPVLFVAARSLPRDSASPWFFVGFLWMGLLSFLFSVLVLVDLVRLGVRFARRFLGARGRDGSGVPPAGEVDPGRRQTLARLLAGTVALFGLGLGGEALAQALEGFRRKHVRVELEKLPRSLDGFRIVQLTDVHVGPTIGRDFVEDMVSATNELLPDVIAITGDLVDGSVEHLRNHVAPLAKLRARHGVFFVTGNHEYYSGADAWIAELERLGVRVLRNQRVTIGTGDQAFELAGVTDYSAARFGDAPDLDAALAGCPPDREVVLLAHQPRAVHGAAARNVGLVLSGHTHGGQFWPWSWVVHLAQPVVRGLARFGRTLIYVSSGTGYWGPPMRLGTEAEITLVELQSAQREVTAATRSATRTPSTAALTMPPA